MGYTITEKIFRAHQGGENSKAGDFVWAKIDFALGNDITAPIAIKEFEKAGFKEVFDKDKIALTPDHFTPNKDIKSANQCKILRDFARTYGIKNYFEIGRVGIEHVLLPEEGLVLPGDLIIGADSHTCTYGALGAYATGVGSTDLAGAFALGFSWFKIPETIKFVFTGTLNKWFSGKDLILYTIGKIGVDGALSKAMEFTGDLIKRLSMDDRFTISNMAIEAGARAGIIEFDDITRVYVNGRAKRDYKIYHSDADAQYEKIYEWDVTDLEPQVALPHSPGNVKGVSGLGNIEIDQVVIGSCTNGRLSDLRKAAEVIKGRNVHERVRLIIIPATQKIYLDAMKEGLLEIFVKSGAVVSAPTCGPCLGGHMGILADYEKALATTNRNFLGRMGSSKSEVYLSNPAVAAASAVAGKIVHPGEIQD